MCLGWFSLQQLSSKYNNFIYKNKNKNKNKFFAVISCIFYIILLYMLKSSILGKDFVNYRKITNENERIKFSSKIRNRGTGNIPIVIDSVDKELSLLLAKHDPISTRNIRYGFEIVLHMDQTIDDIILLIKQEIDKKKDIVKTTIPIHISLGLEDGTILDTTYDLGTIYKKHRNPDDKILYILMTKETSIYGYIMSIINYLIHQIPHICRTHLNIYHTS